jgi:uncharacterized protein (DUF1800 family)
MDRDATTALTRFALGPRPGERAEVARDPRGWLLAQLGRPADALIPVPLPASDAALRSFIAMRDQDQRAQRLDIEARRQRQTMLAEGPLPGLEGQPDPVAPGPEERGRRLLYLPEVEARTRRALTTPAGLLERLVLFWANHFAVSIRKGGLVTVLIGGFEREAIRPHVLGRFADMLLAVERHPAMILYLDNERSTGPNSPTGRARGRSLNENLAREILELHTLGVDGGYTQTDVTSFAKAITGWTMTGARDADGGRFVFRANMHEPGAQRILGRDYGQAGEAQGRAVLADLAVNPSTARHIARKLAAHFVADQPPPALVAALAESFRRTDGDLKEVVRTLILHPDVWAAPGAQAANAGRVPDRDGARPDAAPDRRSDPGLASRARTALSRAALTEGLSRGHGELARARHAEGPARSGACRRDAARTSRGCRRARRRSLRRRAERRDPHGLAAGGEPAASRHAAPDVARDAAEVR